MDICREVCKAKSIEGKERRKIGNGGSRRILKPFFSRIELIGRYPVFSAFSAFHF
jgi:hypothetical protein